MPATHWRWDSSIAYIVMIAEPAVRSRDHAGETASFPDSNDSALPLLKLLTFLSPAFPIGSFAYSHGLERRIDDGRLADAESLWAWIADLLETGTFHNDAVLFAEAYRCAAHGDAAGLRAVAELGEALAGSAERHIETMAQGRAFLAAAAAWPCAPAKILAAHDGAPYPVSVAALAAGQKIPLRTALPAFLNAAATNLVSVAVRLVPLGQTAGLRVVAALHPLIATIARRAGTSSLDDLGSATLLADIAAMNHETQHARIFRT